MDAQTLNRGDAEILPVTLSDIEPIKCLQPPDWPDISLAYSFYVSSWFCKPIKLVNAGKLIGVGCLIRFEKTCWLGQIIIDESFRKQGWGEYLTRCLMDMAGPGIETISLLATPMGKPLYKKIGFETQGEYTFYKKYDFTPYRPASQIKTFSPGMTDQLLALDLDVSGEDRSRLLLPFLKAAWVCTENHELQGYHVPDLGEGLIISREVNAGLDLLGLKLKASNKIVIPEENTVARDFLLRQGFSAYRTATRMFRGLPVLHRPEWIYSRIGGNLG